MDFHKNVTAGLFANALWAAGGCLGGGVMSTVLSALGAQWYWALVWVGLMSVALAALIVVWRRTSFAVELAFWGFGENHYSPATPNVRALICDGRINAKVTNASMVGGKNKDPFKGEPKQAVVVYSIGGQTKVAVVAENGQLSIP